MQEICGNAYSSQNLFVTCQKPPHPPNENCMFEWTMGEENLYKRREPELDFDFDPDE